MKGTNLAVLEEEVARVHALREVRLALHEDVQRSIGASGGSEERLLLKSVRRSERRTMVT